MGESGIPAIRMILEEAAAMGTRTPEVYLALANIYFEEVKRTEEAVRLARENAARQPASRPPIENTANPEAQWVSYMRGAVRNFEYDLQSSDGLQPRVAHIVTPYYPAELLAANTTGAVVLEVQITSEGAVGGIWTISALPDVFANLATASVRDWRFEPISAKIRLVLQFKP
jgi:outer membrane biosynthesis protein TonB